MDKYELVERYEALGDENDFLAAGRLFEQDLRWLRLLSSAYLQARDFGGAAEMIGTGLGLSPGLA